MKPFTIGQLERFKMVIDAKGLTIEQATDIIREHVADDKSCFTCAWWPYDKIHCSRCGKGLSEWEKR